MNEPALTEAVETDLPSPKPNRRKRLVLRFAAFVVAVSVLGTAYWFTRPPELVWWRSPLIRKTSHRAVVLIPNGWKVVLPVDIGQEDQGSWTAVYEIVPSDARPWFLKWLNLNKREDPSVNSVHVGIQQFLTNDLQANPQGGKIKVDGYPGTGQRATRPVHLLSESISVNVYYYRMNFPAFARTYERICNSLKIE